MKIKVIRAVIAVALVGVGSLGGILVMASTASASTTEEYWTPSYYDCQYIGDVLAQQGQADWFTCAPGQSGGYVLTVGTY